MIYDAILCVGGKHIDIAVKSIRSLLHFSNARKIFVISSIQTLEHIRKILGENSRVLLLDEDHLIDSINIKFIQKVFEQRIGSKKRAGWYFQQFLKMSVSSHPEIADHYLVWDCDTILFEPIVFFDSEQRVLINPKSEYHKPYFYTLDNVLGIDKQVNFSFISEHFMVKTDYMRLLVESLIAKVRFNTSWVEYVLDSIDDKNLGRSGFSEYETYGNFIALKFRDSFSCRSIKSTRHGTQLFGTQPDKYAIFSLMYCGYAFATFESRHKAFKPKVLILKAIARTIYTFCYLSGRCSRQLKAATELAR